MHLLLTHASVSEPRLTKEYGACAMGQEAPYPTKEADAPSTGEDAHEETSQRCTRPTGDPTMSPLENARIGRKAHLLQAMTKGRVDRRYAYFSELRWGEVRRITLPRTPLHIGESTRTLSCLWRKGLGPAAWNSASGRKEQATNATLHDAVRLYL
jgi:hypothetical protein